VKPGRRTEMVQQIGMGPADPRGNRLQRHRRGALLPEKLPGGRDCGGPAFFLAQPFTNY